MLKKASFIVFLSFGILNGIFAQKNYWQQRADYKMDIDFDVNNHKFRGKQTIKYKNNSPDELNRLYYHLYFNAFQSGSEMDVRSRTLSDPDPRVKDRISKLNPNEIGYMKVKSLTLDGKPLNFKEVGTILEVSLIQNIKSGKSVTLQMEFEGQVPQQIRRSGRNNREGISYSMAQWYPKLCEYDYMGWHPNPYIAREFYGIWGNFDVNISIDSKYVLGGTGALTNATEIGHGYAPQPKFKPTKSTWKFKAENVHDFMWAADPDYKHIIHKAHDGTMLHFFYQENEKTKENWENLPKIIDKALVWMNKRYGKYPYPQYSFIQGGDGGMEYPQATLITGERTINSLVGVAIHEWMHSWYQNTLATNEALYPWMDEGFTSFASTETMDYLIKEGVIKGKNTEETFAETVNGYIEFMKSGLAEPITQHSDHYATNTAYGVSSYTKGSLALLQMEYIMGKETFRKALLKYYDTWKFKHPHPQDFFRIMEKESNMILDWYQNYWVNTTDYTDYAIDTIVGDNVYLARVGAMPMPLEVEVEHKDGKKDLYYIPLTLMRGKKSFENTKYEKVYTLNSWDWAQPFYPLTLAMSDVKSIHIVPNNYIVDMNIEDNIWPKKIKD
jgi:hypothetical protein